MQSITAECSMNVVQAELEHLKSAFEGPRIYMTGYFADLIYKVDMECQAFLVEQKGEESEASIKAWDDQSVIVDAIKSHECECLKNMPTDEFDWKFGVEMEARIKECEVKMGRIGPRGEHECWEISYEVQDAFDSAEEGIFEQRVEVYAK